MNTIVKMTGPHKGAVSLNGRLLRGWKVAVVSANEGRPITRVYKCLSYRRALSLSCHMAHDRKLHLHVEALPR